MTDTALARAPEESFSILRNPGRLREVLSENLGGEKLSPADLDTVRIPTGGMTQWSVPTPEGDQYVPTITGIIVHQHNQRAYWKNPYGGGDDVQPDCSSNDGVTPWGTPGDEIREAGQTCDDCPLSKFGSDSRGKGQACRVSRRLYVVQPGSMLPIIINLAPTSIANIRKYMLRLGQTPYFGVITKFTLSQKTNSNGIKYAVANAELVTRLDREAVLKVAEYRQLLTAGLNRVADEQESGEEWD